MAQVPPPISPPGAPPPPRRKRRGCLGCGLGCLIPVVLVVLLVVGGFYFLVVQASASVSVPAQLVVLNPATTLVHGGSAQPATSGAQVHENDQVRTDANGGFLLKAFIGKVHLAGSNGSGVDVSAGQQASAAPNGAVSPAVPIAADPNDPFTLWLASEEGAKAAGQPATAQTSFNNGGLATGQTQAQPDYSTAGGEVIGELAYPGSNMQLTITDPNGVAHQNSGGAVVRTGKLVVVDIPNGPGGAYKV